MEAVVGEIVEELEQDFFRELKERLVRAIDDHFRALSQRGERLQDVELSLKQREEDVEHRHRRLDARIDSLRHREQQLAELRAPADESGGRAPATVPAGGSCPEGARPIGLLFHGQETPYVGMLSGVKDLPAVRDILERSERVLGYDVLDVCTRGSLPRFNEASFRQPVALIGGLAALEKLRSERGDLLNRCRAMAGMSVGEYTALCAAGVFTLEDGLRLVLLHGEAMEAASALVQAAQVTVTGLEKMRLMDLCSEALRAEGGVCQISIEWFPRGFTVRGTLEAVLALEKLVRAAGALHAEVMRVATAMHTPLLEPARARLDKALEEVLPRMKPPNCAVYMNGTAAPVKSHTNPKVIATFLKLQLTNPVLWEQSVRAMISDGALEFYELGPSVKLKDMMTHINSRVWESTTCVQV